MRVLRMGGRQGTSSINVPLKWRKSYVVMRCVGGSWPAISRAMSRPSHVAALAIVLQTPLWTTLGSSVGTHAGA